MRDQIFSVSSHCSVALYLGFGLASPFFPIFLASRELTPQQIGLALSLSAVVRLASGPLAGRLADHLHQVRGVLSAVAFARRSIRTVLRIP